jgi:hypothetical protein
MTQTVNIETTAGINTPGALTQEQRAVEVSAALAAEAGSGPNAPPGAGTAEARPTWLPEKFNTAEDMAAAYSKLESKLGAPAPVVAPAPTDDTPAPAAASDALSNAGLDMGEFTAEFTKDGGLGEASYEKLAGVGIDKATVDAFISGQQAISNQFTSEVHSSVGGAENYTRMTQWAADNLTSGEADAFDAAMDSGNADQIKLAVSGVSSKFQAATNEPNLLTGTSGAGLGGAFSNWDDAYTAMADPRYKESPDYRADIKAKLGRSNL